MATGWVTLKSGEQELKWHLLWEENYLQVTAAGAFPGLHDTSLKLVFMAETPRDI